MISYLRRVLVESWLGRVVAIVVFLAFVGWGIGDVIGFISEETDVVARVGQHRIPTRDLAMALRSEMPTITQQMGVKDPSAMSPIMQGQIARQVLQRLIAQAELLEAARQLKIIVPDSAIREEVFALPYFKGPTGQFDRSVFNQRLSAQGLSEQQVLDMIRDDLTVRSLLQPMAQGGTVSSTMFNTLVNYGATTRMVDLISIPVAAQPAPPRRTTQPCSVIMQTTCGSLAPPNCGTPVLLSCPPKLWRIRLQWMMHSSSACTMSRAATTTCQKPATSSL